MSASDRRSAVCLAGLVVLSASASAPACARAPEPADAPDVSELLSTYAEPRGLVDTSRPASWLVAAEAQVDLLGGGNADVVLTQILDRVTMLIDQASLPSAREGPLPARIDGVAKLEIPCGFTADAIANVEVAIRDGEVSPLLWGTASACPLWQGLGTLASYDGKFVMYRYPGEDVLVRVDGTIRDSGARVRLDFRRASGRLETRVVTPLGEVIAARDGRDVVARAANGTFRCSRTDRTCR
jgi:hypothetical protein